MGKKWTAVLLVAFGLMVGLALNGTFSPPQPRGAAAQQAKVEEPENADELMALAVKLEQVFNYAARRVQPAVVRIDTLQMVERTVPSIPSPFEDFFGTPFRGQRQRVPRQGLGSGMILDQEGNVLTNNHVVAGAEELQVRLGDGRVFDAQIVATDEETDLAVIRMQGEWEELPTVEFGDSDRLEVGQWVLALGNPFGIGQTVSAGIVSAKGRSIMQPNEQVASMIQTDAAINRGNSGGPLINLHGQVIGINSSIFASPAGGYVGIGFAIPSNIAIDVMSYLVQGKQVVRGWLGVAIRDLTPQMAEQFDYTGTDGVLIEDVFTGSPADEAGLQPGDIVMRYRGEPTATVEQLRRRVMATEPGTKVQITVWREGKEKKLTAGITRKTGDDIAAADNWLGIQVGELPEDLARQLGRRALTGVITESIEPASPLADRVQPGSVILSVARQAVRSPDEFWRMINQVKPGERVLLRVLEPQSGIGGWILVTRPED